MTTDHPTPPKPRRRWFQFSLRTLFVLLTVLCVWLAVTVNRARKQREAVAAIEAVGGMVLYEHQYDDSEPPGPKWLRELVGDEYFVSVDVVFFVEATDADLEHMEAMKRAIKHTLGEAFHIHHTTLEFEFAPCHDPGCYEVNEAEAVRVARADVG